MSPQWGAVMNLLVGHMVQICAKSLIWDQGYDVVSSTFVVAYDPIIKTPLYELRRVLTDLKKPAQWHTDWADFISNLILVNNLSPLSWI